MQVGLGDRMSHYPAQLSGGEQQRVALARALSPRPSLLIADEPTGNLDDATGRAIMDLIFALPARRGATLALVTHDPALAARCDRVDPDALRRGRERAARSRHERARRSAPAAGPRADPALCAARPPRRPRRPAGSFSSASRSA